MKQEDDKMMANKETPGETEAMKMEKEKEQEAMAMKMDAGASYLNYKSEADAQALVKEHNKDVVYFFAASWCPDCQAIDKKLNSKDDLAMLGKNTVIIKVDYDKEKDLKKKYGITRQTAFVRIDAAGMSVKQAILSGYSDLLTF
jgi:thiol-disulfide isomerase/thioredoxin